MSTTILLIENDAGFARQVSEALEARGFQVRLTGDGKEGLELAREISPAGIVLCVELPKMSGYSICQKLKKDEALRSIPLVLTSAEATPETFESHKKLKARAEDYLLKPYSPADLINRLAPLTGLPAMPVEEGGGTEEVALIEADLGLEPLGGEAEAQLAALDLSTLPDEPVAGGEASPAGHEDEDLRFLDDAFEGLSTSAAAPAIPSRGGDREPSPAAARPFEAGAPDTGGASLPGQGAAPAGGGPGGLASEAQLALGALPSPEAGRTAPGALDGPGAPEATATRPPPAVPPLDLGPELAAAFGLEPRSPAAPPQGAVDEDRGATGMASLAERLASQRPAGPGEGGMAELARLEGELTDRRAALAAAEAEVRNLSGRLEAVTRRATEAEAALTERDAEIRTLRTRADALLEQNHREEAALEAAREEARRSANQARAAEERARAAEEKIGAAETRAAAASDRSSEATERLAAAEERARGHEAQAASASEKIRGTEAQLLASRAAEEKARAALGEVSRSLEAKVAELALAAAAAARLAAAEHELDELKTELIVARGEAEGARSEVDRRSAEFKKRIAELEAANTKNEDRVVKAYLKIKGDEKVRDKARKALSIASQLLEEGLPAEPAASRPTAPGPSAKLE
jgi:CheY-like chemotaxis protein